MDSLTKVIIVILLLRVGAAFGQPNLLQNGDFEKHICSTCYVTNHSQIELLKGYYMGIHSPDLYASLSADPRFMPPNVAPGYQKPESGNNFVGIGSGYIIEPYYTSESISTTWFSQLKQGKRYRFVCYISLANSMKNMHKTLVLAFDSIDIRDFTTQATFIQRLDSYNQKGYQIELISDTADWVYHSYDFVASGTEKHMHLFLKMDDSDLIPIGSGGTTTMYGSDLYRSYYYIDNMSLIELPDPDNPEEEVSLELPNTFTPNADGQNDEWKPRSRNFDHFELQVFNRYGTLVFQSNGEQVHWDGLTLSGEPAAEGVYFIQLSATDRYGELHERQETVHLFR